MAAEWHAQETFKSLLSISDAAFKYLGALNGATWLSVLTFAEKIPDSVAAAGLVRWAILFFIASLALTGVCYVLSYLTQLRLFNEVQQRAREGGHVWHLRATILLYLAAIVAYALGAYRTTQAFFG